MENINESPAVCKPKITALAQLVALYAECRGVTSTAELVAATGYTERAIRKAKAELGCRNQGAAGTRVPEPQCRHGTPVPLTRNPGAVSEPRCRNQGADSASRTHAHIELPSGVVITKKEVEESEVGKTSKIANRQKSPRGARLQPDWSLPTEWFNWTRINLANSTPETIKLEADKFRDYWIAKSGQQAAKLDWEATWRNWCRTAFAARPATIVNRPAFERKPNPSEALRKLMADRIAAQEATA